MNLFITNQEQNHLRSLVTGTQKEETLDNHSFHSSNDQSNVIQCLNHFDTPQAPMKTANTYNPLLVNLDQNCSHSIQKTMNKCKCPYKSLLKSKAIDILYMKQKELEKSKIGSSNRRKFTENEDRILRNAVNIFGTFNWKIIASLIPGRNPRQCRDRYTNYLAPGLVQLEWSEEEDKLLAEKFQLYGPKWTFIRQFFPTRSANDIKNRYNYTVCHKIYKYNSNSNENQIAESNEIKNLQDKNENKMIFELENEYNQAIYNDEFNDFEEMLFQSYVPNQNDEFNDN